MKRKVSWLIGILFAVCILSAACVKPQPVKLAAPTNLDIILSTTLKWTHVPNSSGYSIKIDDAQPINSGKENNYSLAHLEKGEHEIQVKALGDGENYSDSDWSEKFLYTSFKGEIFLFTETNNEYAITGLSETGKALSEVLIPAMHNGKKVVKINNAAFFNCTNLTSIVFENNSNLTSIGEFAFRNCQNVTKIVVPNSVTIVGAGAFSGCNSLTEMTLPFAGSSREAGGKEGLFGFVFGELEQDPSKSNPSRQVYSETASVTAYIPRTLTTVRLTDTQKISYGTFSRCKTLTTITLPNNLTAIGDYSFADCVAIIEIRLGDGVKIIGNYAFANCEALIAQTLPQSLISIQNRAFSGCPNLIKLTLPSSIEEIGIAAFEKCVSLTIEVLGTTPPVQEYSFNDVRAIIVPQNKANNFKLAWPAAANKIYDYDNVVEDKFIIVGSILISYFGYEQNVAVPSNVTYIANYAFSGGIPTTITLPQTMSAIGNYAFFGCKYLREINLPALLNNIGSYAFYDCVKLEKIAIPNNVTELNDGVFGKCRALAEISFDANSQLKTIKPEAFLGCSSLTAITIPDYVTKIAFPNALEKDSEVQSAFRGCANLKGILVSPANSVFSSYDGMIFDKAKTTLLLCPEGKIGEIEIPASVTAIVLEAFYSCTKITYVSFESGSLLQQIASKGFYECMSLLSMTIPQSTAIIGAHAFVNCHNLTIYTSLATQQPNWDVGWNSSGKSVFWGCALSNENYVVQFVRMSSIFMQSNMSAPYRKGFVFAGWSLAEGDTTIAFTMDTVSTAEYGTILYTIWQPA